MHEYILPLTQQQKSNEWKHYEEINNIHLQNMIAKQISEILVK